MKIKNKAFSLIELSIVILIIGILIAGVTQGSLLIGQFKLNTARTITQSSAVPSIEGLSLWLESTSEKSLATGTSTFKDVEIMDNGESIGRWNDINPQKSSPLSVSQSTIGNQPTYYKNGINGLPVIKFVTSSSHCLSRSSVLGEDLFKTDQASIFVVQKYVGANNTVNSSISWAYGGYLAGGKRFNLHAPGNAGNIAFDFGTCCTSGTGRTQYTSSNFANTPYVISAIRKVDTGEIRLNGGSALNSITTATSTLDTSQSATLWIGCGLNDTIDAPFNGYIGEIIVYNRALKNQERVAVEQYLGKKWGIKVL
jgi:prepilin-type N-terminal cleavage/methylation domain-containing protein